MTRIYFALEKNMKKERVKRRVTKRGGQTAAPFCDNNGYLSVLSNCNGRDGRADNSGRYKVSRYSYNCGW